MQLVCSKQNITFAVFTCWVLDKETSVASLKHFNKSTIPSTIPCDNRENKNLEHLSPCLLLMFDAVTDYLHSFTQSKLGERLPACR